MEKYAIKEEWEEYYNILEILRRTGKVNMWGASPHLAAICHIDIKLAKEVLANWIHNYDELNKKYGWGN